MLMLTWGAGERRGVRGEGGHQAGDGRRQVPPAGIDPPDVLEQPRVATCSGKAVEGQGMAAERPRKGSGRSRKGSGRSREGQWKAVKGRGKAVLVRPVEQRRLGRLGHRLLPAP